MSTMTTVRPLMWDNFKDQFDESWHEWVRPIVTSMPFAEDFAKLREFGKTQRIIPSRASNNLFRCFRETKFQDVRVVVVGLSPYNALYNGEEIADGLAMSCSITKKEQPTLTQWYNAMEQEFGGDIVREPDLSYLAQRGVLLYNKSMTTPMGNATGHLEVWEYFTERLFKTAISHLDVPVIALGKEAAKVHSHLLPWQSFFQLKHPASASYAKTDWDSEGVFQSTQELLQHKNIPFSWVISKNKF